MTAGGTRGRALIVAGTLAAPATAGPDVVGTSSTPAAATGRAAPRRRGAPRRWRRRHGHGPRGGDMRGHGRWRALLVLALVAAQGCWLQAGFDARRSGFNGGETGITSATVARLAPVWTATVGGAPREAIVFG